MLPSLVSIPYRLNEIKESGGHTPHNPWFQFLIGSMKCVSSAFLACGASAFQFLIGSMKSGYSLKLPLTPNTFQFLIGSMKFCKLATLEQCNKVSIPYRLNEITPLYTIFIQLPLFQFLIGSMK